MDCKFKAHFTTSANSGDPKHILIGLWKISPCCIINWDTMANDWFTYKILVINNVHKYDKVKLETFHSYSYWQYS